MSGVTIPLSFSHVFARLKLLTRDFPQDCESLLIMRGEIAMYLNAGTLFLADECRSLHDRVVDLTQAWTVKDMHSVTFLFLRRFALDHCRGDAELSKQVLPLIDQESCLDSDILSVLQLVREVPPGLFD